MRATDYSSIGLWEEKSLRSDSAQQLRKNNSVPQTNEGRNAAVNSEYVMWWINPNRHSDRSRAVAAVFEVMMENKAAK